MKNTFAGKPLSSRGEKTSTLSAHPSARGRGTAEEKKSLPRQQGEKSITRGEVVSNSSQSGKKKMKGRRIVPRKKDAFSQKRRNMLKGRRKKDWETPDNPEKTISSVGRGERGGSTPPSLLRKTPRSSQERPGSLIGRVLVRTRAKPST